MKKGYFLLLLLLSVGLANAADWQYAVNFTHNGKEHTAWMWIPPQCTKVKGLIVSQQAILEITVLENQQIRNAATKENLAIVFFYPSFDGTFNYGDEKIVIKGKDTTKYRTDRTFLEVLTKLADVSGYPEVATAPFLPIGHSGNAIYCWNLAYKFPQRTFGVVTLKASMILPPSWDTKAKVDGIPFLCVSGRYEMWATPDGDLEQHWRWLRGTGLHLRAKEQHSLISVLVEPGAGHFSFSDELANYVSKFIEKAAHYRISDSLNLDGTVKLKYLSFSSGWLTDINFLGRNNFPPAPYHQYNGDKSLAFWHLDQELALMNDSYLNNQKGKKYQMLSFVEEGKLLQPKWLLDLKFQPIDDGMSFQVKADFLTKMPDNVFIGTKSLTGHALTPIEYNLIGGWSGGSEQISPDKFRIKFTRFGLTSKTGNIIILAKNRGDNEYENTEQPAQIKFPFKNKEGKPQTITFSLPDSLKFGVKNISLNGNSDAGLPVEYYVKQGPAEIRANQLQINDIPIKSKYPIKIVVEAYQWGRMLPPLVQTAEIIEETIYITKK